MKKYMNIVRILLIGLMIIMTTLGYFSMNIEMILWCLIIVWVLSSTYLIVNKIYILSLFNFVMFIFLMGNFLTYLIDDKYLLFSNDINIVKHVFNALIIALLTVTLVGVLTKKRFFQVKQKTYYPKYNVIPVRLFSLIGFYIAIIFTYIEVIQKIIFVNTNGYIDYYLEYSPNLPYIFLIISSLSTTFFYIYIGTFPKLKKMLIPTLLYLFVGIMSLFFGQRNHLILRMLVVLIYFILYNSVTNQPIRLKLRYFLIASVTFPLFLTFLNFWGNYRYNEQYEFDGIIDSSLDFLHSIGGSVNILEYGIIYKDEISENVHYSLGEIEIFFRNNTISKILGIEQIPNEPNTVDTALYGRSFGSSLMYYQNRTGYLAGYGIGSSYIAEVYNDFSYIGIFITTLLYAFILINIFKVKKLGFLKIAIILSFSYYILYSFRSPTFSFLTNTFTIPKIIIYISFSFIGRFVVLNKKVSKI